MTFKAGAVAQVECLLHYPEDQNLDSRTLNKLSIPQIHRTPVPRDVIPSLDSAHMQACVPSHMCIFIQTQEFF